jgi:hypothetical protein
MQTSLNSKPSRYFCDLVKFITGKDKIPCPGFMIGSTGVSKIYAIAPLNVIILSGSVSTCLLSMTGLAQAFCKMISIMHEMSLELRANHSQSDSIGWAWQMEEKCVRSVGIQEMLSARTFFVV